MQPFLVPDDFRTFMKRVVVYLDGPAADRFLDAEDALHDETGHGGRIDGIDTYRFAYIASDGLHKWEVILRESAIRDIADGLLIEVPAERHEILRTKHRTPSGEPVLIWGEYAEDALWIHSEPQLLAAIDGLHESAAMTPRMLRLWSASDDQVVGVMFRDACALYVVESLEGYATSTGDRTRNDSFELLDHDGRALIVPWADCVPWPAARRALVSFVYRGDLGPELEVEGRIPSQLLMMGDVDRKAALAARAEAPRELTRSSLPRMLTPVPEVVPAADETTVPHEIDAPLRVEELAAWARRLLDLLHSRELVELGPSNLDEITYQLGGLLQAHGTEAQHSIDTAEWLANEIGAVRGIAKLFATGGDLQIALRRSREP